MGRHPGNNRRGVWYGPDLQLRSKVREKRTTICDIGHSIPEACSQKMAMRRDACPSSASNALVIVVKLDLVAVPSCKQQFLSFNCDLEDGHEGFHRDGTTRSVVYAYWPAKMPPKSEIRRGDSANCVRDRR